MRDNGCGEHKDERSDTATPCLPPSPPRTPVSKPQENADADGEYYSHKKPERVHHLIFFDTPFIQAVAKLIPVIIAIGIP